MGFVTLSLQMLFRRAYHYMGMLVVLALITMLVIGQGSTFMARTGEIGRLMENELQASIWVVNEPAMTLEQIEQLKRVDGVIEIAPIFTGKVIAELPRGREQRCLLIGVQEGYSLAAPSKIIQGQLKDLALAKSVVIDIKGSRESFAYRKLGKLRPLCVGGTLKIAGSLTSVVAVCETKQSFNCDPVIYTNYELASSLAHHSTESKPYILIKTAPHASVEKISRQITQLSGAKIYTQKSLSNLSFFKSLEQLAASRFFACGVLASLILAACIIAQSTYSYCKREESSLKIFKAIGCPQRQIYTMVLIQSLALSCISWLTGLLFYLGFLALFSETSILSFLSWKIAFMTLCGLLFIVSITSLINAMKFLSSNYEAL